MNLAEQLRDPLWQVLLALLGLFVTAVIFLAQKKKKTLVYKLTGYPLVSVDKSIKTKVQMLFEQKPISDVTLLSITMSNIGNSPIVAADFECPLAIRFGEQATVLETRMLVAQPKSLSPSLQIRGGELVITPFLLNAKDLVKIAVLVSGFSGGISFHARIAGVSVVKEFAGLRQNLRWSLIPAVIGIVMMIPSGIIGRDTLKGAAQIFSQLGLWDFSFIVGGAVAFFSLFDLILKVLSRGRQYMVRIEEVDQI